MLLFFQLLARLPLPLVHFLGATLGMLGLLRSRHRRVIADNLRHAGLYSPGLLVRTSIEWGKGLTELAPIWLRPLDEVTGWVREVRGWEHVEAARAADEGKGMIVLGPHLGCLELAGLYLAARLPITALYSRPRQAWVHAMMQTGRNRGQAHMVEPNLGGVRALLGALKRNQAAWVLPDQKANKGEGAWAPLFGRWAYLPTLLYRLAGASGARPLLFYCERLDWGRGYRLIIEPLPAQYLWSYRLHRLFPGDSPPAGPPR